MKRKSIIFDTLNLQGYAMTRTPAPLRKKIQGKHEIIGTQTSQELLVFCVAACLRAFGGVRDIIAAILALLALISPRSASGVVIAWIFSLWGTADLFNAFYQANHAGLLAGQLGAAYFIPTLVVPLLLITHGLAFRILLLRQPELAMQASRHPA